MSDRFIFLSLALMGAVFLVDLSLPLGVAAAVPYTFAVLLALRSPNKWFAPALAALCWILTIAKMGIVPERGSTEMWKVIANRCLALFAIGMTAFLGIRRKQAEAKRQAAEHKLREHLTDLTRVSRMTLAGQFASGLAHELNQPLAALCLQAEIAEGMAANSELQSILREVAEQGQRAAEIVRGIRRLVHLDPPEALDFKLAEVVQSVVRLVDAHARRSRVEIRLELGELPEMRGDRIQLEQVIFNLLQNAIEAIESVNSLERIVTVSARVAGAFVVVSVCDTGPGFGSDENRLFEQFFTTKPKGMGLGLAISRAIVESHGGRMIGEPAAAAGATVTFSLPIAGE